jgi:hypothetical protein
MKKAPEGSGAFSVTAQLVISAASADHKFPVPVLIHQ